MPPTLFAPSPDAVLLTAREARLTNPQPRARHELLRKLSHDQGDFDARVDWHVPGLVYGIESDSCMTGREQAPANIAYDQYGAEFIFRQPRDETELTAVLNADSVEVMSCYRFDGLDRWTVPLVHAWLANTHVLTSRLDYIRTASNDPDILSGAEAYTDYLHSPEFHHYIEALLDHLARSAP